MCFYHSVAFVFEFRDSQSFVNVNPARLGDLVSVVPHVSTNVPQQIKMHELMKTDVLSIVNRRPSCTLKAQLQSSSREKRSPVDKMIYAILTAGGR
jgi:hypothetical protein